VLPHRGPGAGEPAERAEYTFLFAAWPGVDARLAAFYDREER